MKLPGTTNAPPGGVHRTRRMGWWTHTPTPRWKGRGDVIWSPDTSVANPWNHLWRDQHGEIYLALDGGGIDGVLLPGWPSVATCPLPDLGAGPVVHDLSVLDLATSPDVTLPVITVISPPVGSTIRPSDPFVVEVTDAGGLALLVLTVELPAGGAHEVVWIKGAFSAAYSEQSTITAIADGYRFSLLRRTGWSASPTFHVEVVDTAGNVGV